MGSEASNWRCSRDSSNRHVLICLFDRQVGRKVRLRPAPKVSNMKCSCLGTKVHTPLAQCQCCSCTVQYLGRDPPVVPTMVGLRPTSDGISKIRTRPREKCARNLRGLATSCIVEGWRLKNRAAILRLLNPNAAFGRSLRHLCCRLPAQCAKLSPTPCRLLRAMPPHPKLSTTIYGGH